MGTRGLYIFRYDGKWYVFYNHWDSYPSGLGQDIVKELRTIDFERVKDLLSSITKEHVDMYGSNFEGVMKALENPSTYRLEHVGEKPTIKSFDIEYEYTINLDDELFEVNYFSGESGRYNTQRFPLRSIPDAWERCII